MNDSQANDSQSDELPNIYISAINPGFTINGQSNVGELIEINRKDPDDHTPISLAGIILCYTNSSGNSVDLLEFPSNVWMTGESILLRSASSPGNELADLIYSKNLAQKAGPLVLKKGDEIIDSICWTGKDGCAEAFKTSAPTTLVHRIAINASPGPETMEPETPKHELIHLENYELKYDKDSPGLSVIDDSSAYETPENPEGYGAWSGDSTEEKVESCTNLEFSEVLAYYESSQSEQFIEFYNPTAEQILLNNCAIKYKNKQYPLEGTVGPDEYVVRLITDFSLTKNPTASNTIELVDLAGKTVASFTYYNGQKKATSIAKVGYDENGKPLWKNTYTPTPGSENIYQSYKPCEEGKVLNEETGNCIKPTIVEENTCKEGYYKNPETGRCKKIQEETAEEKTCKEGYYLNPLTNRCKKIVANTGADYPIEPIEAAQQTSSFAALAAVIGLIVLAIAFIIFEFRKEIIGKSQKVFHRLFHKKVN